MQVDICVATFKRPTWLEQLLRDIAAQEVPADVTLRVIVVDNDPAGSARSALQAVPVAKLGLLYLQQPEKNIALTRNMALDHCTADWVVLVDDDETVPPHWLRSLLECQSSHGADVVLGPVNGRFTPSTPHWILAAGFFVMPPIPSGTELQFGGTGNALLRGSLVRAGQRFDPRFGLTGGEDTEFFFRLHQGGYKMVWCQEASAFEHVPAERMKLRWLLRRSFRGGQMFADIVARPKSLGARCVWALRQAALMALNAALALCLWPAGRGPAARHICRLAGNVGQLSTLSSFRFQEYR